MPNEEHAFPSHSDVSFQNSAD